jgi:hypothetical protein
MIHGQSPRRQGGITLLGFLIAAAFIGLFVLAGIKLVPVYLEFAKIQSTLTSVRDEEQGQRPTIEQIRSAIERRFDIEDVRVISAKDVKITRVEGGYELRATYDGRTRYLGNLYLVAEFDTAVEVMR